MDMQLNIPYKQYSGLDAVDGIYRNLALKAEKASFSAYAPYSNFRVGAALLLDNGEIISASNQESEAFPSGICAERALLYYYQANFSDHKIKAMAIYSPESNDISPCGACRQVMYDSEKRQEISFDVMLCSQINVKIIPSAKDFLPFTFNL